MNLSQRHEFKQFQLAKTVTGNLQLTVTMTSVPSKVSQCVHKDTLPYLLPTILTLAALHGFGNGHLGQSGPIIMTRDRRGTSWETGPAELSWKLRLLSQNMPGCEIRVGKTLAREQ